MFKLGKMGCYREKMGGPVVPHWNADPGAQRYFRLRIVQVSVGEIIINTTVRCAQWAQDSGPDCTPH